MVVDELPECVYKNLIRSERFSFSASAGAAAAAAPFIKGLLAVCMCAHVCWCLCLRI